MQRRWRRLDQPGLELMRLRRVDDEIRVGSTIIDAGETPFALTYAWTLDRGWRTQSLRLNLSGAEKDQTLLIERAGPSAWRVDGKAREEFDTCLEVDLSATPFCNGLAIKALGEQSGDLTALYINAATLDLTPSRQRYERLAPRRWRYIDKGVAKGFEAVLELDSEGLVARYEDLFEALD